MTILRTLLIAAILLGTPLAAQDSRLVPIPGGTPRLVTAAVNP